MIEVFKNSEITNEDLKTYKEEYDRLMQELRRLDLQMEAILTTAAIKLEKVYNSRRLDYAHLSNAYSAFTQNNLDSMQFNVVDITIRDLFFRNEKEFKFITIVPYESGAYEFMYQYHTTTISIKLPVVQNITKDNINNIEWGIFTVYEITKRTEICNEKLEIIRSDDTDVIKTKLFEYLNPEETVETLTSS